MIRDPNTMSESHRNDRVSKHDAGEPLKTIGDQNTMPKSH